MHLPLERKVIKDLSNKTEHIASNNSLVMIGLLYKAHSDGCRHKHTVLPRLRPYPVPGGASALVSLLKQCTTLAVATSQLVLENIKSENSIAKRIGPDVYPKIAGWFHPISLQQHGKSSQQASQVPSSCLSRTAALRLEAQLVECIWPIYVERFEEQHGLAICLQ